MNSPSTNKTVPNEPSPTSTLVIINFNDCARLLTCLESLRDCGRAVLVYDNHSSDASAAQVRAQFPTVHVVESSSNAGYGAAANRALELCDTPYAILCNSDVVFLKGSLEALENCLHRHPKVALAGPRLLNADGTLQRSCFAWPGSRAWWFDNDLIAALLGHLPGMKRRLFRAWDHDCVRQVPWINGAVLALRLNAVNELRGFDEAFFMYHEESDLCWRAAQKGWEVCFTPAAEVIHFGGSSTDKVRAAMAFALFCSTQRFALKHYSPLHARLHWMTWKAIMLGRVLRGQSRLVLGGMRTPRPLLREDLQAWKRAWALSYRDLANQGTAPDPGSSRVPNFS